MTFYQLPKMNDIKYISDNLFSSYSKTDTSRIIINKTLHKYLNNIKKDIEDNPNEWDKYKKYTNTYEFIHTSIPDTKNSVSTLKPLSRSFYKMIEICNLLKIFDDLSARTTHCKSFHLAEGPGGFIEALAKKRNNPSDLYYGMTLIDESNNNVPGWRKTELFLKGHKNVIIEKGNDGTGNLMNPGNLLYCYKKYKGQMDLITADGGFDFSVDFNNQEKSSLKLILCQIAFAIAMQKVNGTFIIKFFDTFTKMSLDMIFLLSNLYEEVFFVKPNTSRSANSEKYIVCKKFKLDNPDLIIRKLYYIINNFTNTNTNISNNSNNILSLFIVDLPYYFTSKIEEYNAILGQHQLENISNTINLIINSGQSKNVKLELMKKSNIAKCVTWCQDYNIPCNKHSHKTNIFLNNKS